MPGDAQGGPDGSKDDQSLCFLRFSVHRERFRAPQNQRGFQADPLHDAVPFSLGGDFLKHQMGAFVAHLLRGLRQFGDSAGLVDLKRLQGTV